MTRFSFSQKIMVWFGLAALALALLGTLTLQSHGRTNATTTLVSHTYEVIHHLEDTLSLAQDIETGQRGYVLTGRSEYLEPYRSALPVIAQNVRDLERMTRDNPLQQQRVRSLSSALARKQKIATQIVSLRERAGFPSAQHFVLSGRGKSAMDEVRRAVATMQQEEVRLLKERRFEAKRSEKQSVLFTCAALGFGMLVLLAGYHVVMREVKAREHSEAELSLRKALLEAQNEASPDGILALAPDGTTLFSNYAFTQLWELTHESIESANSEQPGAEQFGAEQLDNEQLGFERQNLTEGKMCSKNSLIFAPILKLLQSPATFHTVLRRLQSQLNRCESGEVRLRDGRTIEWYSSPLNVPSQDGETRHVGRAWFFRDITERKEVDRMKAEFVSTVSHELRTPLTAIRGSLGLVGGGALGEVPDKVKPLIQIAVNNTDRLIRLINDILDIEKIESRKIEMHMEALPLIPLLHQAIDANRAVCEQNDIELKLVLQQLDGQVRVDRERFLQVMTNLISNAAKFSPPETTVHIGAVRQGNTLRISVSDHGPGISKKFQSRIFGKFEQADSSDTRAQGGSGLGLSITKAIVEMFGGSISFNTSSNGTTFLVDLPEHRVQEARAQEVRTQQESRHAAQVKLPASAPEPIVSTSRTALKKARSTALAIPFASLQIIQDKQSSTHLRRILD
jgi:signal transduction histidine kinase/CHASE3 domain sensor protein